MTTTRQETDWQAIYREHAAHLARVYGSGIAEGDRGWLYYAGILARKASGRGTWTTTPLYPRHDNPWAETETMKHDARLAEDWR